MVGVGSAFFAGCAFYFNPGIQHAGYYSCAVCYYRFNIHAATGEV